MKNNKDVQELLKIADKLDEMRRRYKDNKRAFAEIGFARQCVYDCAMDIQCEEGKDDE